MLQINDTIEVVAHEVDRFGQGVCRYNDFVVFVYGLLKDEKAMVSVSKVKKQFAEATIRKLMTTSDLRKTQTSRLGALDLYHLQDDAQLDWQQTITAHALTRALGQEISLSPIIYDEAILNYRNKVVYHVLDDELMRLGLYTKQPIDLVEVHVFMLNSLAIQRCVSKIQQQSIQIDPKIFKHIVLRSNEKDEVLVTLVAYDKTFTGLEALVSKIKTFKEVVGITLNIKPDKETILGPKSFTLYGKNEIQFHLNELKLRLNDRSFMQVNIPVMLKVYARIKNEIHNNKIIDAYSGIGSIGYYIGDAAKKITMIENNADNISMARDIKKYHAGDYEIIEGNTESVLPMLDADILIVDPPRAGLHGSLLEVLKNKKFTKIIYLSCELNTLTRDLKSLVEVYDIQSVTPIRMFPQTTAIETLVILSRK